MQGREDGAFKKEGIRDTPMGLLLAPFKMRKRALAARVRARDRGEEGGGKTAFHVQKKHVL